MSSKSYHRKSNLAKNCEDFYLHSDNLPSTSTNTISENFEQGDIEYNHGMDIEGEDSFDFQDLSETQSSESSLDTINPIDEGNQQLVLLEISKTFTDSNLCDSSTKKMYELMLKLSHRQIFLPSYNVFKKATALNSKIKTSQYFMCFQQNKLISKEIRCCSKDVGELVTFNLKSSIEFIISTNKEYLWPCQVRSNNIIGDFKDSKEYHDIWHDHDMDGDIMRITLLMNIDDAAMIKSNKTTVTPISYAIAELPPHRRYLKDNVMLAAVWWGPVKLKHDDLWQKAILDDIESFDADIMIEGRQIKIKIKIGLIIMDSVAKPKSMNIIQFNGYYGCPYCLIPGNSMQTNRGGSTMTYPFKVHVNYDQKDHQFYISNGIKADQHGPSMGVKGSTILTKFIKLPKQAPIDYMHCWLEGAFKTLISMKPYSDNSFTSGIDSISGKINLPHEFSRKFRKISEMTYWKAHECKTFLCYLTPLTKNFLEPKYFVLLMAMTFSLRILLMETISQQDIYKAEEILRLFLIVFQDEYGEREMKYNFHLLTHLPDQVRVQGSLVHSSAFVYESNIHHLKTSFHGSRGQLNQICRSYLTRKSICLQANFPKITWNSFSGLGGMQNDSVLLSLPSELIGKPLHGHIIEQQIMRKINAMFGESAEAKVEVYARAKKGKTIFHSIAYNYKRNSASFYFCFKDNRSKKNYGQIRYFIKVPKEMTNRGHDIILVCYNTFNIIERFGLFAGLSTVKSSQIKSLITLIKDLSLFSKLKLTEKSDLISLSKIHKKAIVYPEPPDNKVFWGTCFDSAYEHD